MPVLDSALNTGAYHCRSCRRSWCDDLPPLWTFMDVWPKCCGHHATLVYAGLELAAMMIEGEAA